MDQQLGLHGLLTQLDEPMLDNPHLRMIIEDEIGRYLRRLTPQKHTSWIEHTDYTEQKDDYSDYSDYSDYNDVWEDECRHSTAYL